MRFCAEFKERADGFLNSVDAQYFANYSEEIFFELLRRERVNIMSEHFLPDSWGSEGKQNWLMKFGSRLERALLIDKMFAIGAMPQMQMVDKSIIF